MHEIVSPQKGPLYDILVNKGTLQIFRAISHKPASKPCAIFQHYNISLKSVFTFDLTVSSKPSHFIHILS